MKFLYITPEHVSGTLSLFKREHERRGDSCRFVTFWHSRWDFEDDICLELPLMPDRGWVRSLRAWLGNSARGNADAHTVPYWTPSAVSRAAFSIRDFLNWPQIEETIRRHRLDAVDLIQLDGGLDFTRDSRFIRERAAAGVPIVCFYHGSDMRNRGIVREVDELTAIRFTSEWDLLELDSRLHYLYLPFDTAQYPDREYSPRKPVRICHAARNPYKGTPHVVEAVNRLQTENVGVELILLKDMPYQKALREKYACDVFVDQLTNEGGWGYGMSSVEALAMGMPVITNIPPQMDSRIAPHPFIQADPQSLHSVLKSVVSDSKLAAERVRRGQEWVRERHDVRRVMDCMYTLYEKMGWMSSRRR